MWRNQPSTSEAGLTLNKDDILPLQEHRHLFSGLRNIAQRKQKERRSRSVDRKAPKKRTSIKKVLFGPPRVTRSRAAKEAREVQQLLEERERVKLREDLLDLTRLDTDSDTVVPWEKAQAESTPKLYPGLFVNNPTAPSEDSDFDETIPAREAKSAVERYRNISHQIQEKAKEDLRRANFLKQVQELQEKAEADLRQATFDRQVRQQQERDEAYIQSAYDNLRREEERERAPGANKTAQI